MYIKEFNALNKHIIAYDQAILKGIDRFINDTRS